MAKRRAKAEDILGAQARAEYEGAVVELLAEGLTRRFSQGFSRQNLQQMHQFHLTYRQRWIRQTLSGELSRSAGLDLRDAVA